jgi:hypothetical protein
MYYRNSRKMILMTIISGREIVYCWLSVGFERRYLHFLQISRVIVSVIPATLNMQMKAMVFPLSKVWISSVSCPQSMRLRRAFVGTLAVPSGQMIPSSK